VKLLPLILLLSIGLVCPGGTALFAQPETGKPLPRVLLSGDQGGLRSGGSWEAPAGAGKPALLAYIHPDREGELQALLDDLARTGPSPDSYQRFLIHNTRASWKPDRVIQMGHWFKRMGQTIDAARREGIVQALLLDTDGDKLAWTPVYDRTSLLRSAWQLPDADIQLLVLDAQGRLRYYRKGAPGPDHARALATILRKLG
jgi:hypothetical protein